MLIDMYADMLKLVVDVFMSLVCPTSLLQEALFFR
jgi:hypothetical protein